MKSKEEEIQNQKMFKEKHRLHHFGYKYFQNTKKQQYFHQTHIDSRLTLEDHSCRYELENQQLSLQLEHIKLFFCRLLYPQGTQIKSRQIPFDQLMEELLLLILDKAKQNDTLKKENEIIKASLNDLLQTSQYSSYSKMIQMDVNDSRYLIQVNDNDQSDYQIDSSKVTNKYKQSFNTSGMRCSEESSKTRSMYRPRVLFEIGKQVNTINQLSSKVFKNDSQGTQNSQLTSQLSFRQLDKFNKKGNRMSIQKSIIIDNQNQVQRVNIYSNKLHQHTVDIHHQHTVSQTCYLSQLKQNEIKSQGKKFDLFLIKEQKNNENKNAGGLRGLIKLPRKKQRLTYEPNNSFKKQQFRIKLPQG